jgi:uncharacterized membrane protein YgcG
MKKLLVLAGLLVLMMAFAPKARAIDADDLKNFYRAVGAYFKLTDDDVHRYSATGISNDDLPVVLIIAQRANIPPDRVIEMRRSGKSWNDITTHFGLNPEIFYVKVNQPPSGPPYGNAYGYYKNKKGAMNDDDYVNMANLKFLSEHYGYQPDEIIKIRSNTKTSSHDTFVNINKEVNINVEKNKIKTTNPGEKPKDNGPADKSKGHGSDKGKDNKGPDKETTGKGPDKEKGGGNSHKGGSEASGGGNKGGGGSHKGGGEVSGGGGNSHKGGGKGGGGKGPKN